MKMLNINTATVNGDVSVRGGDWVTGFSIDARNQSESGYEDGFEYDMVTGGKGTATVTMNGNVTAEGSGYITAVNVFTVHDSIAALTLTGDATATNDTGNASAVEVSVNGGSATLDMTGNATAVGQGNVRAVTVWSRDNTIWAENDDGEERTFYGGKSGTASVTLEGDLTARITGSEGGEAAGVDIGANNGSTANLAVTGDITAVDDTTDDNKRVKGIGFVANENSTVNVAVVGDVTATGKNAYGVYVIADESATGNVLVDGTVSGEKAAFCAADEVAFSTVNIYVWKAEENADGEIVKTDNGSTEPATKLEAAIWYIIKVSQKWQSKLTATGTNTYKTGDATYDVAHEDDSVTLKIDDPSGKKLSAIMYNDGTEADYVDNGDGTYTIKMLRGGGMMLSLNLTDKAQKKAEQKSETPAEQKAEETETAEAQEDVTYEAVAETQEVNGVKAADHPEAAEALATVGEALDGESVTVEIPGAEKLMDEEEIKTFNKLPVKDRLLVVLSALGFVNDTLGDASEGMSDEAKALSESIAERMASLSEDEKQALLDTIAATFPKGNVIVDGQERESFSIDLVINRNGVKTYERYTFYDEDGTWKLYGIEKGVVEAV